MRWKFTLGMTLLSTSAMIFAVSPDLMSLSALMAAITSSDRRLISASGASSAASANRGRPTSAAAIIIAAARRPRSRLFIHISFQRSLTGWFVGERVALPVPARPRHPATA